MEPVGRDPQAGLDQFLGPVGHVRHCLFVGQPARLEVPGGLDQQDEAHRWISLAVEVLPAAAISAGAITPGEAPHNQCDVWRCPESTDSWRKTKWAAQSREIASLPPARNGPTAEV